VTESTLLCDSPERIERAQKLIGRLPLNLGAWEVEIRKHRKKRGPSANARLWALHTKAADHTGYSPEEMHDHALCRHFGFTEKQVVCPFTGEIEIKRIPLKRSSSRDTKEFGKFMEETESWYISAFGVFLGDDA
jgi:hypothetical protein